MRTLAVDFGERRIGLAISDASGAMALPLVTLERSSDRAAIAAIKDLARERQIERIVVGDPRQSDGSRGDASLRAARFAGKLADATQLPCELVDETLTTREAAARLAAAGIDVARHPERLDSVAAQILLEEVLGRSAP